MQATPLLTTRARRQGLGGAGARGAAAETARSGDRRRACASARRPSCRPELYDDAAADQSAVLDAGVHRNRSRHDSDRAGRARCAADGRELRHAGAQGILRRRRRSTASCRISWCRPAIRAATAKADRATRFATSSTSGRTCAAPSAWRSTGPTPAAVSSSSRTRRSRTSTRKYTVFGRVISGMDVVDQIEQGDVIRRVQDLGWNGDATRATKLKRGRRPPPFSDGRGQLTASCRPSSSRPWLSLPLSFIPPFMWV